MSSAGVLLQVIGSTAATGLVAGDPDTTTPDQRRAFWVVLSVARFIVGVGVGGIYPLSAAVSIEAVAQNADPVALGQAVGRSFFWMSPG